MARNVVDLLNLGPGLKVACLVSCELRCKNLSGFLKSKMMSGLDSNNDHELKRPQGFLFDVRHASLRFPMSDAN